MTYTSISDRVLSVLLPAVMCIAAAGCQHRGNPRDTITNASPQSLLDSGQLVVHSRGPSPALLFIASEAGRVYYAANQQVFASFPVNAGDSVLLNGGYSDGRTATEVTLNGRTLYLANTRAADNRFYFISE